jgi:hypothetical protein
MDLNARGERGATGITIKRNQGKCCTQTCHNNQPTPIYWHICINMKLEEHRYFRRENARGAHIFYYTKFHVDVKQLIAISKHNI